MLRHVRPVVLLVPLALALVIGCGGSRSSPASTVPSGYESYFRDGQLTPTGHPTLDYWVRVNWLLSRSDRLPSSQPESHRMYARAIRAADPAGVDPELVAWAGDAAGWLDRLADVLRQLDDPRVPADGAELDQRLNTLEADRRTGSDRGRELRDALARRHRQSFPPCQW